MALRLRRGTEAERGSVIFQEGELVYVTDTKDLYAGDGVTPGGIKVSNVGSPDALTQNLDLDGFNILGSGTVTATAFVGDGSGLTNLPIGAGGVVEGVNYRINIVGNDSSTIVNSATNTLTGLFVGDGSNITNILLDQLDDAFISFPSNGEVLTYTDGFWVNAPATGGEGIVAGGDYRINIIGTDSTRIIDTNTNTISGQFVGELSGSVFTDNSSIIIDGIDGTIYSDSIKHTGGALKVENATVGVRTTLNVNSVDELSRVTISRESNSTINDSMVYGRLDFVKNDPGGLVTTATVGADNLGLFFAINPTGITSNEPEYVVFSADNNFGIGVFDPQTKLEIKDGRAFYDGVEWRNIVASGSTALETVLPGGLFIGAYDQATINSFGLDSANITGSIVYNSDSDRFEFFQSGSWIPLANQELEETSDVRFASVTADSFISTGAGTPTLESATNLDLQAGNAVRVIGAPFRLANLTTTQRNALTAANGDMIYNSTANRIQAYQNGAWINLDDGTSA